MKKEMLLTVGVIAVTASSFAQGGLQWARKISGVSYDLLQPVVTGKSGQVYAAGTFKDQLKVSGGDAITSAGSGDLYLASYDASGKLLWNKSAGGAGMDMIRSLAVDGSDNVVAAGCFEGRIDLDPGSAVLMAGTEGQQQVFVSKFTSEGDLLWSKYISSPEFVTCNSVKSDHQGNIYFTGSFRSAMDFDPGAGEFTAAPAGRVRDLYVVKLDSQGNFQWAQTMPLLCDDLGTGFVVTPDNDVLIAGGFYGVDAYDVDPSSSQFIIQPTSPEDLFLLKLSSDGKLKWAKHFAGSFYNGRTILTVNTDNDVFFAGNFHGSVDLDPTSSNFQFVASGANPDGFLARFSSEGDFIWARQIGGFEVQQANGLSFSKSGEVVLSGIFQGQLDADPGQGTYNLHASGAEDVFMIRFDMNGEFVCAGSVGGQGNDRSGGSHFDEAGNLLFTGSFATISDLDPGSSSYLVTPEGGAEFYVCKISDCSMVTKLPEQDAVGVFKIFPNPSKGDLTILVEAEEYTEVRVLNILGTEVLRQPLKVGNNALNLGGFPKGIYFACLTNDSNHETAIRKIVVH